MYIFKKTSRFKYKNNKNYDLDLSKQKSYISVFHFITHTPAQYLKSQMISPVAEKFPPSKNIFLSICI